MVIIPSGACASVPGEREPATQRTQRGTDGTRSEATNAASVTRIVMPATIRFENSMKEW